MGILDKVKNLFTEEIEEEPIVKKERKIEIKKPDFKMPEIKKPEIKKHQEVTPKVEKEIQSEVRKVEIAPARRESKILLDEEEDFIKESPALRREEKSVLPIYFSDEDFDDLEKPKKEEKKVNDVRNFREIYQGKKEEPKKEEIKTFKPSPVISPVYGVLDKNYTKEDITTKEVPRNTYYRSDKVTVDDVRNKAYGTLEDDLENNLFNTPIDIDTNIEPSIDIFEELENNDKKGKEEIKPEDTDLSEQLEKQKQRIEEINKIIKDNIKKTEEEPKNIDNILEQLDDIEEKFDSKIDTQNEEEIIEEPDEKENEDIIEEVKENNEEEVEEPIVEDIEESEELEEETKELDEDKTEELEPVKPEEDTNNKEEFEDTNDELVEDDLFNLIDSMYETRDE